MSLGPCRDCSAMISEAAPDCPRCGAPAPVRKAHPDPEPQRLTWRQRRRIREAGRRAYAEMEVL